MLDNGENILASFLFLSTYDMNMGRTVQCEVYYHFRPVLGVSVIAALSKGIRPRTQIAKHFRPNNLQSPTAPSLRRLSLR